ncbi:GntR family transcriptional regulator [Pseudactinotalea sp.]|uniref:GntR family transcriptional regulator n=1 Tax=Pseudactinotalea sp. TaxID=1926260 RepID=UPI003B3BB382
MAEALYTQVHEALRRRIREGTIAVGDRLPSQEELTEEFSVSAITIKRALDMLRDEGFVVRRPRIGTVVVSQRPERDQSAGGTLVGYVVPGFDDAFGTRVLSGILAHAEERAHVVVGASHGDADREQRLIESQLERGIDALVLLPSSSDFIPPAVVSLVGRRFPIVIVDRTLAGTPVSTVTSDNVAGGRRAAAHLFDLGHERIALALSPNRVSTLDERRRGFVAAHASHHVRLGRDAIYDDVRSVVPGSTTPADDDVERLAAYLTDHPDITGVVAGEYHSARLVLQAARRAGRDVPTDLSIVCFDAPPEFVDAAMPFTHIEQDQYALGARALDLALEQLADPASVRQERVPVTLVEGSSTASRSD